jgi:hypothetical protein
VRIFAQRFQVLLERGVLPPFLQMLLGFFQTLANVRHVRENGAGWDAAAWN